MPDFILAIDQGTTSSRAIVFDAKLRPKASAQKEFKQYFPDSGWVEHDPEEIWKSVLATCRAAISQGKDRAQKYPLPRHHQPARNHGGVGAQDGQGDPQGHCLAGPAHGGDLRRTESPGT